MKRLLLIVLPVLLIVGCSKEPINYETTLDERWGELFYTKDTNKPYSGPVFSLYEGSSMERGTGILKEGKKDGLWIETSPVDRWVISKVIYKNGDPWDGNLINWYENGQNESEVNYKDGKEDGLWTKWYKNGQMEREETYKEGEEDGLGTSWYENGQKSSEGTYKDGKEISFKMWNSDGSVKE